MVYESPDDATEAISKLNGFHLMERYIVGESANSNLRLDDSQRTVTALMHSALSPPVETTGVGAGQGGDTCSRTGRRGREEEIGLARRRVGPGTLFVSRICRLEFGQGRKAAARMDRTDGGDGSRTTKIVQLSSTCMYPMYHLHGNHPLSHRQPIPRTPPRTQRGIYPQPTLQLAAVKASMKPPHQAIRCIYGYKTTAQAILQVANHLAHFFLHGPNSGIHGYDKDASHAPLEKHRRGGARHVRVDGANARTSHVVHGDDDNDTRPPHPAPSSSSSTHRAQCESKDALARSSIP